MMQFWIGLLAICSEREGGPSAELYAPGYGRQQVTLLPDKRTLHLKSRLPVAFERVSEEWGRSRASATTGTGTRPWDVQRLPYLMKLRKGDSFTLLPGEVRWEP